MIQYAGTILNEEMLLLGAKTSWENDYNYHVRQGYKPTGRMVAMNKFWLASNQ